MTLKTILDSFDFKYKKNSLFPKPVFINKKTTRKKVSEYLKMCHTKYNMSYELIYQILNNNVGLFYHYENSIIPYESEYDFIEIEEDGYIYIWCEVDGFMLSVIFFNITISHKFFSPLFFL